MNSVIIAGSRTINDYNLIKSTIVESGFKIDEIVCGCARGVDILGKKYGVENNIPVIDFPAEWNNFKVQPLCIKTSVNGGKYNSFAGHIRNRKMAEYASHLILIWNGFSSGSASMRKLAKQYGLTIFEKMLAD